MNQINTLWHQDPFFKSHLAVTSAGHEIKKGHKTEMRSINNKGQKKTFWKKPILFFTEEKEHLFKKM